MLYEKLFLTLARHVSNASIMFGLHGRSAFSHLLSGLTVLFTPTAIPVALHRQASGHNAHVADLRTVAAAVRTKTGLSRLAGR